VILFARHILVIGKYFRKQLFVQYLTVLLVHIYLTKETATTEHLNFLQHNIDNIIVYTDGSKGQSLGSAFVIYYKGNIHCEHKFSIGSRAEVFDAEVAAITNAIHYLAYHPLLA
jgi:hypothetical protein